MTFKEILEDIDALEELLSERIAENNALSRERGIFTKQATHAFVLYRGLLWDIKAKIMRLK